MQFAVVLIFSTLVNFWLASRLRADSYRQRWLFWVGIGFNVAALTVFRLGNFYLPEITAFLQHLGVNTPGDG
jgi:D-alanyl-lipoteichoic acid acyltransferase DltB (MBOAT superfamily)